MRSPKTTITGIGSALVIIGAALKAWFDGDPLTNVDWAVTVPGLLAAIGLVWAKDEPPGDDTTSVDAQKL